jgi:hypothetical protein
MRTIMPRSCDHLWPLYEQYLATMTRCEALGFSLTLDTSTMNLAYLLFITYPLVGQSGHNLRRKKITELLTAPRSATEKARETRAAPR